MVSHKTRDTRRKSSSPVRKHREHNTAPPRNLVNEYPDLNFQTFGDALMENERAYNAYRERKKRNNLRDSVIYRTRANTEAQNEAIRRRANANYERNKAKISRQAILNNVEDGGCVLDRTVEDSNNFYNWTPAELAMFEKCKQLRRERYVVPPQDINLVVDDRYRRPYPYKAEPINNTLLKDMTDYHLDVTKFKWRYKLKSLGRKPFEVYVKPNAQSLYGAYLKSVGMHATSNEIMRLQNDVNEVMRSKEFGPIKKQYLGVSTATDQTQNTTINADARYDWNEALRGITGDNRPVENTFITNHPSHIHVRALAISIGKPIVVITMDDKYFYPGYRFDLRPFVQVFKEDFSTENTFEEDIDFVLDRMKSTITCYDLLKWTKIKDSKWYQKYIHDKSLKQINEDFIVLLFKVNGNFSATEKAQLHDYIDNFRNISAEHDNYNAAYKPNSTQQQPSETNERSQNDKIKNPEKGRTLWTHNDEYKEYFKKLNEKNMDDDFTAKLRALGRMEANIEVGGDGTCLYHAFYVSNNNVPYQKENGINLRKEVHEKLTKNKDDNRELMRYIKILKNTSSPGRENYWDHLVNEISNPNVYADALHMKVLSLLYKKTIVVVFNGYNDVNKTNDSYIRVFTPDNESTVDEIRRYGISPSEDEQLTLNTGENVDPSNKYLWKSIMKSRWYTTTKNHMDFVVLLYNGVNHYQGTHLNSDIQKDSDEGDDEGEENDDDDNSDSDDDDDDDMEVASNEDEQEENDENDDDDMEVASNEDEQEENDENDKEEEKDKPEESVGEDIDIDNIEEDGKEDSNNKEGKQKRRRSSNSNSLSRKPSSPGKKKKKVNSNSVSTKLPETTSSSSEEKSVGEKTDIMSTSSTRNQQEPVENPPKTGWRKAKRPLHGVNNTNNEEGNTNNEDEDATRRRQELLLRFKKQNNVAANTLNPEASGITDNNNADKISSSSDEDNNDDIVCKKCNKPTDANKMLLCDRCDVGYHTFCLVPPLLNIPKDDWYCSKCLNEMTDERSKFLDGIEVLKKPDKFINDKKSLKSLYLARVFKLTDGTRQWYKGGEIKSVLKKDTEDDEITYVVKWPDENKNKKERLSLVNYYDLSDSEKVFSTNEENAWFYYTIDKSVKKKDERTASEKKRKSTPKKTKTSPSPPKIEEGVPYFDMNDMIRVKKEVMMNEEFRRRKIVHSDLNKQSSLDTWTNGVTAIRKYSGERNFYKIYSEPDKYYPFIEENYTQDDPETGKKIPDTLRNHFNALIKFKDEFPTINDPENKDAFVHDDVRNKLNEVVKYKDLLRIHELIKSEKLNEWRTLFNMKKRDQRTRKRDEMHSEYYYDYIHLKVTIPKLVLACNGLDEKGFFETPVKHEKDKKKQEKINEQSKDLEFMIIFTALTIHITRHDYIKIVITKDRITTTNNTTPNQYIINENKFLLTPTNINKAYTKAEYVNQSIEYELTPELKKYIDKFLEIREHYPNIEKRYLDETNNVRYLTKNFAKQHFTNFLQKYTYCLEEPLSLQRLRRSYATYNKERRDLNLISQQEYQQSVEEMRHSEETQRDNYEHKNYLKKIYIPCPKTLESSYQAYHKDLEKRFQNARQQLKRTRKNDKLTQHDQASDDDNTVNTHHNKPHVGEANNGTTSSSCSHGTTEYNKLLRSRYVYTFIGDENDNTISTQLVGIGRIKKNKNKNNRKDFPYLIAYLNDVEKKVYRCMPESENEPVIIRDKNGTIIIKLLPRGYVPFNTFLLGLKVDLRINQPSSDTHKGIIMKNEDIQTMIEKPYVIKYMDKNTSEIIHTKTHIPFIFPEDFDNDTFTILHIRLNEDNFNDNNSRIYEEIQNH